MKEKIMLWLISRMLAHMHEPLTIKTTVSVIAFSNNGSHRDTARVRTQGLLHFNEKRLSVSVRLREVYVSFASGKLLDVDYTGGNSDGDCKRNHGKESTGKESRREKEERCST